MARSKKKTKVQDPNQERKLYGKYECPKCSSQWASPNSLDGASQECRKCNTQVLPKIQSNKKGLTPYQGSKRAFGAYKCTHCNKSWMSANSWANMGQECKECRINIYPHMQRKLERSSTKLDDKKPHLTEFCEKCKTLGHSCRSVSEQTELLPKKKT